MRKHLFLLVSLLVTLMLVLGGCGQTTEQPAAPAAGESAEQPAAEEPAAVSDEETLTIAFSVPDMAFPFFVFMESQVREEAEKLGVEIVTLDGQNQVPKQTADMEAAIAKEYDAVLISPLTADAMAPAVQQVVDAGIPVVTVDRTVFDVETLAHVGADNVLGGEQQGNALMELFPDGTSIFELTGTPGSSPAIDRSAGLHNIIDGQAQIEVACNQTAEFRRDKGLSITENCLGATPNPGAIIAANDEMAFGAVEAAKAAGIASDVIIMGYDALPEALTMVRDGDLYGTVEQFPGEQARTGLRTLVDFLRADKTPGDHDIFITPKLITQDNLDEAERLAEIGGEAAAAPAAEGEPLTIAFSVPDMAFPFFVFMESQVREEAEKLGVEIVTLDGQNQVPKQTADMEATIAKEYDAVLISPLTADAMAPAVQQVVDAGIPVVTVDRTVFDVETLAHVGADNVLGGEQQGNALMELFPDGATIFELTGTPGSSPAIDRSAGLHNIIDGQAQIEVACNQTAEFRRDKGLSITENCLGATPNPNAVIAANDEMAFGAVEAAKAAGIASDVIIMGYDALPEALTMVRDGDLYGTVEQFPGEQARTGLRTLVDFLRADKTPGDHDIFITPKLITQDNLNEAERLAEIGGEAAAPVAEGEPLTIAFSVPDMAFPFFVFMESQVREEAEKLGVEIVTLDGQNQVPKQTADMEATIAKEYDAVLISPLTADAMAPAVQQVVDAGIPVVTVDRTVFDVETLAHVGADNVLGGEQQGNALMELFPDGATIFELTGTPGSSPAIDRSAGLHNIIDGQAQIEVACNQTAEFRRDKGLSITENCLGATPNPNAVIAANDEMAFGAVEAAKAAGIASDVIIMGYDALPEALTMVRDGDLYGTVEQFPGEQARTGLRTLVDFLREDKAPGDHDIFITPKLITQDNLDEAERLAEIQ